MKPILPILLALTCLPLAAQNPPEPATQETEAKPDTTIAELRAKAEQGLAAAKVQLGARYATGQGVPENDAEAVKWYRKAAEQGNADAQIDLGAAYANGIGVPQDDMLAYMWFNVAAASGGEVAKKNKESISARMTKEQIAEAQKLSREWKPKTRAEKNPQ